MTQAEKWRKVRLTLLVSLAITLSVAVGLADYFWGLRAASIVCCSAVYLAVGLWITELLIGVLAGIRKANIPAILLLMIGKIFWWGALIYATTLISGKNEMPIATGIGAFIVAITITGIFQYGRPRISEPSA